MNPIADSALHEWGSWVRLYMEGQGFGGGVDSDPAGAPPRSEAREHATHSDPVQSEVIRTAHAQDRAQRIDRYLDGCADIERRAASLIYVGERRFIARTRGGDPQVWRCDGELVIARGHRVRISLPRPPEIAGRPWRWVPVFVTRAGSIQWEGLAKALDCSVRHARRVVDALHEKIARELAVDNAHRAAGRREAKKRKAGHDASA